MKRISEEKLKNTLKATLEENSSSLDFFANFDESKPALNFDQNVSLIEEEPTNHDLEDNEKPKNITVKTTKKNRFKKYQFVAIAACLVLVTFSAIAIGFDFDTLINSGIKNSSAETDAATAEVFGAGGSENVADMSEESEKIIDSSSEKPVEQRNLSKDIAPAYSTDAIAQPESSDALAPEEFPDSADIKALESEDNTDIEALEQTQKDNGESDANIDEKEKPSPVLTIGLFALAALLTFMLTAARKRELNENDESRLRKIYSVKSIRWTFVILAGASIIAAIVLYTISIL